MLSSNRLITTAVIATIVGGVGCYYLWAVRASGNAFLWKNHLPGYYNYLGSGFAAGQLHLPLAPSPQLLALSDPWDPARNQAYAMHDMVLFNSRFYLYHGAGPAVMVFGPWRWITGYDLPENFALAFFSFAGFLFYSCATLRLLRHSVASPGPFVTSLILLSLAVCQSVPFLTSRLWVYEIAIAGGYFCVAAAICFLSFGLTSNRPSPWLTASGLMLGLAMTCRPHLGFIAAVCLGILLSRRSPRTLVGFFLALVACGAALAAYNFARFGNPLEFGLRYLLAGETDQQRVVLNWANVYPGLYYLLFCAPDLTPVFPWIRLLLRLPFGAAEYAFPAAYFIEPTIGAFYLSPVILGIFLPGPKDRTLRSILWIALLASGLVLLFIAATGFTTQRYMVDFLPLLVFASVLKFSLPGKYPLARTATFSILVLFSLIANLAIGLTGPYDELLARQPKRYVRIAGWFSPIERFRPRLDPPLQLNLSVEFSAHEEAFKEPLVTIGVQAFRYLLEAEHRGSGVVLISHSNDPAVTAVSATLNSEPRNLQLSYDPASNLLTVAADGAIVIQQKLNHLVFAPAQIKIGENPYAGFAPERFTGRIAISE